MKSIFYLLTILFLSLLLACSEEPPTNSELESLSKKPLPPTPPTPLPALVQSTNYIAGSVGGDRKNDPKVFIWNGNDLSREWTGSIEAFTINGIGIGNFVGDSDKELIVQRRIVTGKKRNEIEKQELLIFEKDEAEPTYTKTLRLWENFHDAVWDMKIGNVDNDAELEIVLLFRDQMEIWEYDDNDFILKASFEYYSPTGSPKCAEIGDFDPGLAGNEIIVSFSDGALWRVYNYTGSSITQVQEAPRTTEIFSLSSVKIVNFDNDGGLEVIGSGSGASKKLLLWEDPYAIPPAFITSEELANAPWGVGVGDLDSDPLDGKIVAGVYRGGLHLLHYSGTQIVYDDEVVPGLAVSYDGIIVSDIDVDNSLEIVVATENGLQVFDNTFVNPFVDEVGWMENIICQ